MERGAGLPPQLYKLEIEMGLFFFFTTVYGGETWKCFDTGLCEIKETPKVHSTDQSKNPIKIITTQNINGEKRT